MKKLIIIALLTLSLIQGFALQKEGEKLGDDIKQSFQNIKDETARVGDSIEEKQTQAKDAIDTLNETIDKATETKEALEDIL